MWFIQWFMMVYSNNIVWLVVGNMVFLMARVTRKSPTGATYGLRLTSSRLGSSKGAVLTRRASIAMPSKKWASRISAWPWAGFMRFLVDTTYMMSIIKHYI